MFIIFKYYLGSDEGWKRYFLNLDYHGIITKKLLDPQRRYEPCVVIEGNDESYLIENMDIYNLIVPGDYMLKKKRTTKHMLVKQNDTIYFYPRVNHKDLIDSN